MAVSTQLPTANRTKKQTLALTHLDRLAALEQRLQEVLGAGAFLLLCLLPLLRQLVQLSSSVRQESAAAHQRAEHTPHRVARYLLNKPGRGHRRAQDSVFESMIYEGMMYS